MFNNQGLGFKPSSLGLPASIDAAVDRHDVPRDRREQLRVARRQRPPLQRVHELSGAREPHQDQLAAHARRPGVDARMIRVNVWEARAAGTFNFSAGMTQGPNPNTASSTAGNAHRVAAARHRHAEQRADSELEERRVAELLLRRLRAGRLARHRAG